MLEDQAIRHELEAHALEREIRDQESAMRVGRVAMRATAHEFETTIAITGP